MTRDCDRTVAADADPGGAMPATFRAPNGPTLTLLRHCETEWSRRRLYQGQSDPLLSPCGIEQATRLSETLAQRLSKVDAIVSSPLARSRMTAALIAARVNMSVQVEPLLAEIAYGEWEGLAQAEIKVRWPALFRQWKKDPGSVRFPGGESLSDLRDRVLEFVRRAHATEGAILAVTHIGVMRVILLEARGLSLSEFRKFRIGHGGLLDVHWTNGRLSIAERPGFAPVDSRDGADRSGAISQRHEVEQAL